MLKKLKITSCAFILCLFGLILITVSPVLAEDSVAFKECKQIKGDLKGKKNCFKRLARELESSAADTLLAIEAIIGDNVVSYKYDIKTCHEGIREASAVERLQCWIDNETDKAARRLEETKAELKKAIDDYDHFKPYYAEAQECNRIFKSEIQMCFDHKELRESGFCHNDSREKGCW